jgi:hypothetical protein
MSKITGLTVARSHKLVAPTKPDDPTPSNKGTWTILPGILWIEWNIDPSNGRGEIDTHFVIFTIDKLTGTIDARFLDLKDELNLEIVDGSAELKVTTGESGEIRFIASLSVIGVAKAWKFDTVLAKW